MVLDASVAVSWVIPDESYKINPRAVEHASSSDVRVPSLWPYEIMNSLDRAMRQGRSTDASLAAAIHLLKDLPVTLVPMSVVEASDLLLGAVATYGLTVYDASYLALALRFNCPLMTTDRKMMRAAALAGVHVGWKDTP